jgi:hypothetical protein
MSDIASLGRIPSNNWLGRLMVSIDRWLLTYAEITIRNGDVPRCGI